MEAMLEDGADKAAKVAQDNPDDAISQVKNGYRWTSFVERRQLFLPLEISDHSEYFIRHRIETGEANSTPGKLDEFEHQLNKAHLQILHELAAKPEFAKEKFWTMKDGKATLMSLGEFAKRDATDENKVIFVYEENRNEMGLISGQGDNKLEFFFFPESRKLAEAVSEAFVKRKVITSNLLAPERKR